MAPGLDELFAQTRLSFLRKHLEVYPLDVNTKSPTNSFETQNIGITLISYRKPHHRIYLFFFCYIAIPCVNDDETSVFIIDGNTLITRAKPLLFFAQILSVLHKVIPVSRYNQPYDYVLHRVWLLCVWCRCRWYSGVSLLLYQQTLCMINYISSP